MNFLINNYLRWTFSESMQNQSTTKSDSNTRRHYFWENKLWNYVEVLVMKL